MTSLPCPVTSRALPPSRRARRTGLRRRLQAAALAVTTALAALPLQAQSGPVVEAEILPGWTTDRGTQMVALHLRMSPGWHTYWRIPGEAGIAPRFDWGRSQNVAAIAPIWPHPEIFDQNGYRSYGYEDELILPLEITPSDPSRPMALMGDLSIGVCNETCVPADLSVTGVLRHDSQRDPRIDAALASAARPAERAGVTRALCSLAPAESGARLTLRVSVPTRGADETVVVELPGSGYRVTESRTWREGGELVTTAYLRAPRRAEAVGLTRGSVAYTVLGDGPMLWAQGCTGG